MARGADRDIERRIREAIADDEHLGSLEIQLRIAGGVVVLEGTVDSAMQRSLAEECALAGGAREVINQLEVSGEPIAGTARRRSNP